MFERNILVTGGAGFIGSNFLQYYVPRYPNTRFINLDKLTYSGNLLNLKELEGAKNYAFHAGDITDSDYLSHLFKMYQISDVISFAAESHVDNSITTPFNFVKTNIEGTFWLLETARKHWMTSPFVPKEGKELSRFLHISTDEVYGSLKDDGFFTEETAYAPNSPYSASKASSDMLVRSYNKTYGLSTIISNCSNNYGPRQHKEKLIPTVIRNALSLSPIPIYGKGENIRDWLFVEDHCRALDKIFYHGRIGEKYNVGGGKEKRNIEITKAICTLLDRHRPKADGTSYETLISFVKDRAGHDYRYAIDGSKIEKELGFLAQESFDSGLEKTVLWYLENPSFLQ